MPLPLSLASCVLPVLAKCEYLFTFFFQAEDGIRDLTVTGVQTCALPISTERSGREARRVHFQHRDVRERVLTLDLRREIPSIARRDDDLLSPLRDVLVGDHHPVGRDDEAGPITLHHSLGAARCEELLEGILGQLSLAPQDIDTYHRRSEPARGRDDRSLARLGEILTCEVWRQCHKIGRAHV